MLTTPLNLPESVAITLRERCLELGLPSWQCDNAGTVLQEPQASGPLGLLLNSRVIAELVSTSVAKMSSVSAPEVVKVGSGLWLIGIPERSRRDRIGWTVAMALSAAALDGPVITAACHAAHLDPQVTRHTLLRLAHHDARTVADLARSLHWMAQDLGVRNELKHTADGFTRQLTDSFETIELLYSLGRSMGDIGQPEEFVRRSMDRLASLMNFSWIACWFGAEARSARVGGERVMVAGPSPLDESVLQRVMPLIAAQCPSDGRSHIFTDTGELPLPRGVQYLAQPITRNGRLVGVMLACEKGGDDPQVSSYDIHLLEATGSFIASFIDNATLLAEQNAMFVGSLTAMTASIDAKDRYTCGHSERVAHLARRLARAAGLSNELAERLHICGLVHDVGKIGVPESVLLKPGKLTDDEFATIKLHPEIGHKILRGIPLMTDILPGVLHHHERWDGRGYPHNLAGEAIPLFGRILAIADTFDAMSSNRSYRSAMPRERVLSEIAKCAGTQFDPALVPCFLALDFTDFDRLVDLHRDLTPVNLAAAA